MPTLLEGKLTAKLYKERIALITSDSIKKGISPPHLGIILIGNNPGSQVYVKNKIKACKSVGYKTSLIQHETITEEELINIIQKCNRDKDLDGFIVQLPLPLHINTNRVIDAIAPEKDVDGLHPYNYGRLAMQSPTFIPATPLGIALLLKHYNIQTEGLNAVVIGRSRIVGNPMALLLSNNLKLIGNATVTLCHSQTQHLERFTQAADLIVIAAGQTKLLTGNMIKEGTIVVDVGINRIPSPQHKNGYELVGDVEYSSVAPKCKYITPVPGGVGPMTIVALLINTLVAKKLIDGYSININN